MRGDQTGTNENMNEDFVHATYKLFVKDPKSAVDDTKEDLLIEAIPDEDQTVKCKIVVHFQLILKTFLNILYLILLMMMLKMYLFRY